MTSSGKGSTRFEGRGTTSIDLSIVSAGLGKLSSWQVLDDNWGSDHFPIATTLPNFRKKRPGSQNNQPPDFNYAKADWGHWESQRINLTCWYNNLINGLHTAYRRLARFIYHRLSRYNRSASCLLCCCHTRQFPIPGVLRISIPIETKQKILVFYEFLASI